LYVKAKKGLTFRVNPFLVLTKMVNLSLFLGSQGLDFSI
jgi:hypothetical protein